MELGKVIFKLRKHKGMNQAELAKKAGLSRTAVSQIETGKSTPSEENLQKIAEALGTYSVLISLAAINPETDMSAEKREKFEALFPGFHEKILSFII